MEESAAVYRREPGRPLFLFGIILLALWRELSAEVSDRCPESRSERACYRLQVFSGLGISEGVCERTCNPIPSTEERRERFLDFFLGRPTFIRGLAVCGLDSLAQSPELGRGPIPGIIGLICRRI